MFLFWELIGKGHYPELLFWDNYSHFYAGGVKKVSDDDDDGDPVAPHCLPAAAEMSFHKHQLFSWDCFVCPTAKELHFYSKKNSHSPQNSSLHGVEANVCWRFFLSAVLWELSLTPSVTHILLNVSGIDAVNMSFRHITLHLLWQPDCLKDQDVQWELWRVTLIPSHLNSTQQSTSAHVKHCWKCQSHLTYAEWKYSDRQVTTNKTETVSLICINHCEKIYK